MKIPAISRSGRGLPGEPVRMAIRALATGVTAMLVQLTTAYRPIWTINRASDSVELLLSRGRLQLLTNGVLVTSITPVAPRRGYSVAAAVGDRESPLGVMSLQFRPEKRRDTAVGRARRSGGSSCSFLHRWGLMRPAGYRL